MTRANYLRVERLEQQAKRRAATELDAAIAAHLEEWIAEAVADTTPLDQMEPIDAKITTLLRELAGFPAGDMATVGRGG